MAFALMGLINVRRNLGRSVVAVTGMAVAALVVTSLLSLSRSVHREADLGARFLCGGDVVLTRIPLLHAADDLDPGSNPDDSWGLGRQAHDAAGIWGELLPGLWAYGSLIPTAPQPAQGPWLKADELESILQRLEGNPRVRAAHPLAVLPVLEQGAGQAPLRGFLLGRDAASDRAWLGQLIAGRLTSGGRYLAPSDGDELVAAIDADRGRRGYRSLGAGDVLTVAVPAAHDEGAGPVFDYAATTAVSLRVVGAVSTVTEVLLAQGGPIELTWGSGGVLVPQETLEGLARQAGLDAAPAAAVVVRLDNLVNLDSFVAGLRQEFPELCVASVAQLIAAVGGRGAPGPSAVPMAGAMMFQGYLPRAASLDLDLVFSILAFTIAALIVASNLLILVRERRRELGILRALGATGRDVAVMVLTEASLLSLAGCTLGYWPLRLLSTIALVSNRLPLGRVAALTLSDFGLVLGLAMALTLAFGMLPALASTRMTCMEALRND